MRVGKTLTALRTAKMVGAKNVLFVTKKKAISSILSDYEMTGYSDMALTVINYEKLSKCEKRYDLIIVDEAHSLKKHGKPSLRTKNLKEIVKDNYLILLSGTPTPESYSDIYHQLWISDNSPFKEWKNFYKWAKEFVNIKQRYFNGTPHNDYSEAKIEKIMPYIEPLMITYTQKQASFKRTDMAEEVVKVKMVDGIYNLADYLRKHKYYKLKDGHEIVCETAVSLQNKLHQLYSGTIITDNGIAILDESKARYIAKHYEPPFAVYYKYKAEELLLWKHLKNITTDPEVFNRGEADVFISQVRSGAMGINLSRANVLIAFNIDFSAELYWQMRARIQAKDKTAQNKIVWLFSDGGIEEKIYKAVLDKKSYTVKYFKEDYAWN